MSREIKFRAWYRKRMICWNFLIVDFASDWFNKGYELMQYTGLKDRNGIEIYEGDIITHYFGIPKVHTASFVVSYYVDGFKLTNLVKRNKKNYLNQEIICTPKKSNYKEWNTCEVIGNIYENKDLIISQK